MRARPDMEVHMLVVGGNCSFQCGATPQIRRLRDQGSKLPGPETLRPLLFDGSSSSAERLGTGITIPLPLP